MGKPGFALLAGVLVAGLTGTNAASAAEEPQADPQSEQTSFARANEERRARGVDSLRWSDDLAAVARAHSEDMAREGRLYHNPNLASQVSGWSSLAENVGVGPGAEEIHQAFMDSEAHRDNILGEFTQAGVGAVVDGDQVWITQVFRMPSAPKKKIARSTEEPARARRSTVVRAASGGRVLPFDPVPVRKPKKPRRIPGFGAQTMSSLARMIDEDLDIPMSTRARPPLTYWV